MERLSKPFYLVSPIVNVVASFALVATVVAMRENPAAALLLFAVEIAALLFAGVLSCVLVYKMWDSIQDGYARTTPGKALGFLFIPFFNLYWIFQVWWGFAKDYNAYCDRREFQVKKLEEGLFLAFCIVMLAMVIPFVNIVALVADWVIFFMIVSRVCDAVNALSPSGQQLTDNLQPRQKQHGEQLVSPPPDTRAVSLFCLSGEFANQRVPLPTDGVKVGRDPARVNLVLSGSQISGLHARIIPASTSTQVWLEDLQSLNGTFYLAHSGPGADTGWLKLEGKVLLSPGARFRLALDGPEFEIRSS
jgi:FHA domain